MLVEDGDPGAIEDLDAWYRDFNRWGRPFTSRANARRPRRSSTRRTSRPRHLARPDGPGLMARYLLDTNHLSLPWMITPQCGNVSTRHCGRGIAWEPACQSSATRDRHCETQWRERNRQISPGVRQLVRRVRDQAALSIGSGKGRSGSARSWRQASSSPLHLAASNAANANTPWGDQLIP